MGNRAWAQGSSLPIWQSPPGERRPRPANDRLSHQVHQAREAPPSEPRPRPGNSFLPTLLSGSESRSPARQTQSLHRFALTLPSPSLLSLCLCSPITRGGPAPVHRRPINSASAAGAGSRRARGAGVGGRRAVASGRRREVESVVLAAAQARLAG